jgi:hypothetical protein
VLLADRGFGRSELARTCRRLEFHYVIRIKPVVCVGCPSFRGKLSHYPVRKEMQRVLTDVQYRRQDPVRQNVVIYWKVGLPKKRDEPWFLMTDLKQKAELLTTLYGKRTTVEELFRDDKNKRNGFVGHSGRGLVSYKSPRYRTAADIHHGTDVRGSEASRRRNAWRISCKSVGAFVDNYSEPSFDPTPPAIWVFAGGVFTAGGPVEIDNHADVWRGGDSLDRSNRGTRLAPLCLSSIRFLLRHFCF